jgi:hypothetical protein
LDDVSDPSIQAFHEGFFPPSFNPKEGMHMCRSIKRLYNIVPEGTSTYDELYAAALQFVRKISGFNKPSKVNEAAFLAAVDAITATSRHLLSTLETHAPPRNRAVEAAKARARAAQRASSG